MKDIVITEHALARFQERGNADKTREDLERIFKKSPHIILEPTWRGNGISNVGGYVWVVNKTVSKTIVITCLGTLEEYEIKRPHMKGDTEETTYAKWRKYQNRKSSRRARL